MKLLFFAFFFLHIGLGQSQDQKIFCDKVDSLWDRQEYLQAKQLLLVCIKRDTSNYTSLHYLAQCEFILGDYQQAITYYQILEKNDIYKSDALQKLAIMYETQQNLPKAIKYNILLHTMYPSNPTYLRKLGSLYLDGNEKTQAKMSLEKAYQLNPSDMLTVCAIGELYINEDNVKSADSIVTEGLKVDSNNIRLSLLKSRISYLSKDYKTTSVILETLSYKTELSNTFKKMLGFSLLQIDSVDKAIFHLQSTIRRENNPEYVQYYLGLAYEKKKEYDQALWFFNEAAKSGISNNIAQYHKGMARIYTTQKEYNSAFDQYKKCLDYHKDPEIYFYIANVLEQEKKDNIKAIPYYKKYLQSNPANQEFLHISTLRLKYLKEKEFMLK